MVFALNVVNIKLNQNLFCLPTSSTTEPSHGGCWNHQMHTAFVCFYLHLLLQVSSKLLLQFNNSNYNYENKLKHLIFNLLFVVDEFTHLFRRKQVRKYNSLSPAYLGSLMRWQKAFHSDLWQTACL